MQRREQPLHTPKDSFERVIRMAIDKGKLQNLIFDNYHLWTHRLLKRFLGVILHLGPVRRKLADDQMKSKFVAFARKRTGQ